MPFFRRKTAEVVRRGVGDEPTEERTTRKISGKTVKVRRVRELPTRPERVATKTKTAKRNKKQTKQSQARTGTRSRSRPHARAPGTTPLPAAGRKQMLVRVLPHQTQIVVLEGPLLVEHYVHRSDQESLVGNIYQGVVRSVLPGLEAAFVDIGTEKNGVIYAGDLNSARRTHGRGPRIERLLKKGDHLMVQVDKDPMGSKGPRLTSQVTLPGRHLVLSPKSSMLGISRRLPENERTRLRQILQAERPPGFGLIVRTAAAGSSRKEIVADISRLKAKWAEVEKAGKGGSAPRLIHQEPSLLIRVIREHFTQEFRRLLIDDRRAHEALLKYLKQVSPDLVGRVHLNQDRDQGLFARFRVDDQLRRALDRKVWLPSGGHLVIDRTEALTVIDVNTGKYVGEANLEDTVLHNNLEAAEEIGRQLRLRDIGGIIVIDFIDMEVKKNREAVLERLRAALARDKTTTQVHSVSSLGLVEMTRKNVSSGLVESFSEQCPTCDGRGLVLHEKAATSGVPISPVGDKVAV